jgi:glyceraldehyde-3-phosphate dehydrogenase/erythrose-4-phosphate dehydrogenase
MAVRVAINGFGRIGRLVVRAARESAGSELEIVGMHGFGAFASGEDVYRHFGITAERVAEAARSLL